MGCDIHAYIEYNNGLRWSAISDQLNLDRNYGLFSALAGVRKGSEKIKHFKLRGVPKDIGFIVESDYTLLVVAGEDTHEEGCCTEYRAERYLESYGSVVWEEKKEDSKFYRITNPDWHSPSWLNLKELKIAYERYLKYDNLVIPLIEGYIVLMNKLEELGFQTRIVFWFDN